jgi:hypothetical protein
MDYLSDHLHPTTDSGSAAPPEQEQHLVALLDRAYRSRPSPALDAGMMAALRAGRAGERSQVVPFFGRLPSAGGRRLASLAVALALLIAAAAGSLRLSGPVPVSAKSVLSRAAAAMRLAPGQAAHLTYAVTITPPAQSAGSVTTTGLARMKADSAMESQADVWVQGSSDGAVAMSSQTLTLPDGALAKGQPSQSAAGSANTRLIARYLQRGQQVYGFIAGDNWIVIPGSHDQHPGWMIPNAALDSAGLAQALSTLAQHSPQQVRLLPGQTIDGNAVNVLQVDGWADAPGMRTTFYFDGQSFELRGFDAESIDPSYPTASWQVRLTSYTTVAASDVPSTAFTLNAPADSRVDPPLIDLAAMTSTFDSVCHSTLSVALLGQILQAKQQSLLAACQATDPAVSEDRLVQALLAPYKVTLDNAAAVVQITPAQVAAALTAQQQWLATLLDTPGGGSSLS